jgi:peptidoglycan/LPS O-acetylase OafA/YrhL
MNLNKPILVNWQNSKAADFIRRHRWFFRTDIGWSARRRNVPSLFLLIFLLVVGGLVDMLLPSNPPEWAIFAGIIFIMLVGGAAIVLISVATEEDK